MLLEVILMERSGPETEHSLAWRSHFFYRKECFKTTWKLRLAILFLVILIALATRGVWVSTIGQSLVCREEIRQSDAIIVENFDPNYLLFERAAQLQNQGLAAKVIVPAAEASHSVGQVNLISEGIARLMINVSKMKNSEIIPIRETEPISLNAAYQVRDFLAKEHIGSIIVVTPGFRSKRSCLIFNAVMDQAGIKVHCAPVFGKRTPENWAKTWHGIQEVTLQFLKLIYYRLFVLPPNRQLEDAHRMP